MKLGTLLLRNAVIGLSQLETALRNQVLYGGKLGTNLVDLGFVDVDALAVALGQLAGVPVATRQILDQVTPDMLQLISPELACAVGAIPLGLVAGDALAVAMVDPTSNENLAALTEDAGRAITPYVVPELRAFYYLEKHYGLPRRARFLRSGRRSGSQSVDDRRRTQPPGGIVMPEAVTLVPRKKRSSAVAPASAAPGLPALSFVAACEQLEKVTHRQQVADVFVEFARGRFGALVLFVVRDGNATGWRAHAPDGISTQVEEISLPLGGVSALQAAYDSMHPFSGPPPSPTRATESQLWKMLRVDPAPAEVVVVPVVVKQHAINLVYGHGIAGKSVSADLFDQLCELCRLTQNAYVRLVQQSRSS
jgi:hypothetical protein